MLGRVSVIVTVALASLAGCSSKNPDALNAANVDENYAIAEVNAADNLENNTAIAVPVKPPTNATTNSDEANVDAAVNILREADKDQNEYCEAQQEATGESDCDEN